MERATEQKLIEKARLHFGQIFGMKVLDAYENSQKELFIVEVEIDDETNFFKSENTEEKKSFKVAYAYEERGSNVIITDFRLVKGFLIGEKEINACLFFKGYTAKNNAFVDAVLNYELNKSTELSLAIITKTLFFPEELPEIGEEPRDSETESQEPQSVLAKIVKEQTSFEGLKQHLAIHELSDRKRAVKTKMRVLYEDDEPIEDQDYLEIADFFSIYGNPGEEILHIIFRKSKDN